MLLLCPCYAFAEEVSVTWDVNTEPDLAKYKLYQGKDGSNLSQSVDVPKENTSATVQIDGYGTEYLALSAVDNDGNESPKTTPLERLDVTAPLPPSGFRFGAQ
jgi:fibronectin type 3 domain-containing protein